MIQPPDSGSGTDSEVLFSELTPATDSRFRLRPGSQVFRSDFGRRFRHERGLISLQKPRQKWPKTAHHICWQIGKVYIYTLANLPIYGCGCFFAENNAFSGHFGRFFAAITLI
jgi:hypothetical protein